MPIKKATGGLPRRTAIGGAGVEGLCVLGLHWASNLPEGRGKFSIKSKAKTQWKLGSPERALASSPPGAGGRQHPLSRLLRLPSVPSSATPRQDAWDSVSLLALQHAGHRVMASSTSPALPDDITERLIILLASELPRPLAFSHSALLPRSLLTRG